MILLYITIYFLAGMLTCLIAAQYYQKECEQRGLTDARFEVYSPFWWLSMAITCVIWPISWIHTIYHMFRKRA